MSKQPEALRLADVIDSSSSNFYAESSMRYDHELAMTVGAAADELRRLHELNGELLEVLKKIVRDADAEPDGDYLIGANKGCVAVHRSGIEIARKAITKTEAV